jgi:hypothetical protein
MQIGSDTRKYIILAADAHDEALSGWNGGISENIDGCSTDNYCCRLRHAYIMHVKSVGTSGIIDDTDRGNGSTRTGLILQCFHDHVSNAYVQLERNKKKPKRKNVYSSLRKADYIIDIILSRRPK